MSESTQSHIQTKGWHIDVTDVQIEIAQKAIGSIVGIMKAVYYTEEPDPFSGRRYFWTSTGWEEPVELGCFDHYGNLVIYSAALSRGI